jgi:hypothetical protein
VQPARHNSGLVLQLQDQDPHDFAKAERVFPRTVKDLAVSFDVLPAQTNTTLEVSELGKECLSYSREQFTPLVPLP